MALVVVTFLPLQRCLEAPLSATMTSAAAGKARVELLRKECAATLEDASLPPGGATATRPLSRTCHVVVEVKTLHFHSISAAAGEAIVELLPREFAATLKTLHFHNNMTGA